MARKFGFLLLGVCLVLGALGFVGCENGWSKTGSEETGGDISALVGAWGSGTDSYTITATTLTYDDGSNGEWGMSYTGKVRYISNFNTTSGVVIIEYTTAPTIKTSGDFIGIYYRDLTATTVKLANPYDPAGTTETTTLDEAKAKFTQDNEGTLVNWTIVQPQTKTGGDISALVGAWGSGTDSYTITATTLTYDDGSNGEWGMSYTGKVRYISNFNTTSGVVIIEYTTAPTIKTSGDFIGIYYRDLTATTVKLANPYDPAGTTETTTLDEAKAKFTQDNEGTLVNWTIVQPQTRQ